MSLCLLTLLLPLFSTACELGLMGKCGVLVLNAFCFDLRKTKQNTEIMHYDHHPHQRVYSYLCSRLPAIHLSLFTFTSYLMTCSLYRPHPQSTPEKHPASHAQNLLGWTSIMGRLCIWTSFSMSGSLSHLSVPNLFVRCLCVCSALCVTTKHWRDCRMAQIEPGKERGSIQFQIDIFTHVL